MNHTQRYLDASIRHFAQSVYTHRELSQRFVTIRRNGRVLVFTADDTSREYLAAMAANRGLRCTLQYQPLQAGNLTATKAQILVHF